MPNCPKNGMITLTIILIIKDNDTIFLKTCQFFIEFPSIGGEYQQVPLNV